MAWVTLAEVKQAVADAVKRDLAEMPAALDRMAAQALEKAQGQIRGALNPRGFTEAQLLTWDRLHEFSFDQALFNCEVYLRQLYKDKMGDLMAFKDRTGELAAVGLFTGTDPIVPTVTPRAGLMDFRDGFDRALADPVWPPYGWGGSPVM